MECTTGHLFFQYLIPMEKNFYYLTENIIHVIIEEKAKFHLSGRFFVPQKPAAVHCCRTIHPPKNDKNRRYCHGACTTKYLISSHDE